MVKDTKQTDFIKDLKERIDSKEQIYISDLKGHIIEACKDQNGSRLIQEKFESANSVEKELICSEIEGEEVNLMKDVFGNYII